MQSIKNPTTRYWEGLLWRAALTGWLFAHIAVQMSKASPAVESWVKGSAYEFRHEATPPAGIFRGAYHTSGSGRKAERFMQVSHGVVGGRRWKCTLRSLLGSVKQVCVLCVQAPYPPAHPNYGSYFSFTGPLVRKRDRAVTLKSCPTPPLQCVGVRDQWKKMAK